MSPAAFIIAIRAAVCDWYGFDDLKTKRTGGRPRPALSNARHVAWHAARRHTGFSLCELAMRFDVDHTSVMYGIDRVNRTPELLALSERFCAEILGAREAAE